VDLRKQLEGPDFFGEVGNFLRIVAAVALTPFAAYFTLAGLIVPIPAIVMAVQRDWRFAGMLLGIGVAHGLVGLALSWIAIRLYRGDKSANQVTILPTWLVCTFLVVFLAPLMIGMAGMSAVQAYRAALAMDWQMAVMWGLLACGMFFGTLRGLFAGFRLIVGRRRKLEAASAPSESVDPKS
jgi:hypothetical protein